MSTVSCNIVRAAIREALTPGLDRLGAHVGVNYFRHKVGYDGVEEIQTLFVSCSRAAWVEEFGEPENVSRFFDPHNGQWRHRWEQTLPDGRVCCEGDLFERSSGREWVIVRRFSAADSVEAA